MIKLHSRLLGEDIICLEDGENAPPTERLVCYTRSELAALKGLEAASLRAVHQSKKHFGGRYLGPSPIGG